MPKKIDKEVFKLVILIIYTDIQYKYILYVYNPRPLSFQIYILYKQILHAFLYPAHTSYMYLIYTRTHTLHTHLYTHLYTPLLHSHPFPTFTILFLPLLPPQPSPPPHTYIYRLCALYTNNTMK